MTIAEGLLAEFEQEARTTRKFLERIPDDKLTPAQKQAAAALAAGPRGEVKGPFVALLRSPDLMDRVQRVGEYIRFRCPFDKRINELAAAITARHWTQQFEWTYHYRHAMEAGLAREIADAIGEGRRPPKMGEDEAAAYEFAIELHHRKSVSDATYARALALFGEGGVIDLTGLCGYYSFLAMMMNVARTPAPADTQGVPPLAKFPS